MADDSIEASPEAVAWVFHPDHAAWAAAGVDSPEEARRWVTAGFDVGRAAAWCAAWAGIEPGLAALWRDEGDSPAVAAQKRERFEQVVKDGFPPQEAVVWTRWYYSQANNSATVGRLVTGRQANQWSRRGFTAEDTHAWLTRCGTDVSPRQAARYRDQGKSPSDVMFPRKRIFGRAAQYLRDWLFRYQP